MQKLVLAAVALTLLVGVVAAFFFLGSRPRTEVTAVASAPAEAPEELRVESAIETPPLQVEALVADESAREQVEAEVEVSEEAEAPALAPPDPANSTWVEVALRLPKEAPTDDSLVVLALDGPKTFQDLYGAKGIVPERTRRGRDTSYKGLLGVFPVDAAGRARVAFSKEVATPHMALSGMFLYTEGSSAVDVASGFGKLRPELGAYVTGSVLAPSGSTAEWKEPVEVRLITDLADVTSWEGNSRRLGFQHDIAVGARFEFRAIPVAKTVTLSASSDELATFFVEGLKLEAGRRVDVDLQMVSGARITGRVVDEEGEPVENAEVAAKTREIWGTPIVSLREAETDPEGRFDLPAVAPGDVWITVEREGYLEYRSPSSFSVANGEEREQDIELSSGGSLRGFVAFPDGTPAAGAKVEIEIDLSGNVAGSPVGPDQTSGAGTDVDADASGAFAVSGLGTGPFSVVVELEVGAGDATHVAGKWTAQLDGLVPSVVPENVEQIHLVLEAPLSIQGVVRDVAGAPVPVFEIVAERAGSQWYMPPTAREAKKFESQDGSFTLPSLRAGDWKVVAKAEGFARSEPVEVELPTDELLAIELKRPASVAGQVLDPDDQPVAGAAVGPEADLVELIARSQGRESTRPSTTTDAAGWFVLNGLPPGSGTLRAEKEGYARSAAFPYDLGEGQGITDAVLELRRGGTITGEVIGNDGEPAPGVQVFIQEQSTFQRRSVTSDDEGRFRADHLEPAKWQVTSMNFDGEGSNFATALETMKVAMVDLADETEVHVVLGKQPENPVEVFGRITAAGKPAKQMLISFIPTRGGGIEALKLKNLDDEGRYRLQLAEPGDYLVTLQTLGGVGQRSEEHRYRIPDVYEFELDFELPLGRISGRVIGPDGDAKSGVRVTLNVDGGVTYGTVFGGQFTETLTDDSGGYEIEHLRPGSYRVAVGGNITFTGTSGLGRTVTRIDVREGQWVRDVDFRLESPGKIRGTVKDHAGRAVEGASIFVRDEDGNLLELFSYTETDAGGHFKYEGLAPGRYTISARTDALASGEDQVVEIESDQETVVSIVMDTGTRLVVSLEDKSGELVPALVSVVDDRGREVNGMRSIQDIMEQYNGGLGRLEQNVGPLPSGEYTIRAVAADGRSTKKKVTLSGQEERRVRLRLDE